LPFLFFLTKVGWDQVRQKNVMAMIENFMPLPINASRHYIRSKLRETDCSKEVVRLVLGHWELGQEPFSNMSGLNPSHYREQLKQHWEPVFNTSGWKCQHGIS